MGDLITRFGIGDYSYDFTQSFLRQIEMPVGHGDLMPNNIRLAGISGGYNLDGTDGARSSIGVTQAFFQIEGDGTLADISAKSHAILGMQAWGEKRLLKELADGTELWTWATINNIRISDRSDNLSYLVRDCQITWSTPKARWYSKASLAFMDDGWTLDDGLTLTAPKVDAELVGNGSTVDITNNGNAYAGAYIRWDIPAGVTVTNPRIRRFNESAQVVDEVTYVDTLVGNDVVEIDAREHQTLKNMVVVPAYSKLSVLSGAWLQLPPGTTTLQITGTFSAQAELTVDCWDTYF